MENETKTNEEIIQEAFDALPKNIQKVVTESGWTEEVDTLLIKHNLNEEQGQLVKNETLYVMLGIEPSENLIENIVKNAEIEETRAKHLAIDIDSVVFEKIRSALTETPTTTNAPAPEVAASNQSFKPTTDSFTSTENPSRNDLLREIEDAPVSTPPTSPTPQTPSPVENMIEINSKFEEVPSQQKEIPQAPTNLPTGNISDVPPHGHDHAQNLNSYMDQKLKSTVPSSKETVQIVENKSAGSLPGKNDPYREIAE